ncbi:MAG: multiheme c-type cytochrome [Nannocystaceae bacterium]
MRRRRWRLATACIVCLAAIAACICLSYAGWYRIGCGIKDTQWTKPLAYPNRNSGRQDDPKAFASAAVCGACHTQHYAEWRNSGMGRSSALSSFLIDLYQASLDIRGAPAEDIEQCLRCHAPLAVMGEDPDYAIEHALSREAVNCDVCHTAVAAHANDAPAMIEWDPSGPKRGPLPGSLDPDVPGVVRALSPHHATQYSPLHESSELCGACHMSLWPTNGLPIDWTYPEWKRSPYAEKGITCQNCHMPTYTGVAAPGAPTRGNLHRHTFRGGGDPELVRGTAEIGIRVTPHFAGHEVEVEVENTRAGHAFPTGNATAPVVKLIFEAFDHADTLVFSGIREYRLTYIDAEGQPTNDPSAAVAQKSDTTLQPLEPRHERFFVATHHEAVRVSARLVYQRWNDEIVGEHSTDVLGEFIGRYLKQGLQVHRLVANLDQLSLEKLDRVRNMKPIVVDEAESVLPPRPQLPPYLRQRR